KESLQLCLRRRIARRALRSAQSHYAGLDQNGMERRSRYRLWGTELAGARPVRYLCQSSARHAAGNRPPDAAGAAPGPLRSGHSRRYAAAAGVRLDGAGEQTKDDGIERFDRPGMRVSTIKLRVPG